MHIYVCYTVCTDRARSTDTDTLCLRTLDTHRPPPAPLSSYATDTGALLHPPFPFDLCPSPRGRRGDHGEGIGSGKMLTFPSPTLPVSLTSSEISGNHFSYKVLISFHFHGYGNSGLGVSQSLVCVCVRYTCNVATCHCTWTSVRRDSDQLTGRPHRGRRAGRHSVCGHAVSCGFMYVKCNESGKASRCARTGGGG